MITIDVDSREMFIPDEEIPLGVRHDHETMIKIFRIPRFTIQGVDISDFKFRVLIQRADGTDALNLIDDVTTSDNYIRISWPVRSEAVDVPGKTLVQLEAVRTNEEGIILAAWHSRYGEFVVYPAHENGYLTDETQHKYQDLADWLNKQALNYVVNNYSIDNLNITEAELNEIMSKIFY